MEVLFYIWAKLERLVQFLARQPHLSIRSDEKWCFLQSKNENTEEKGSEIDFDVYEIIEFVEKKVLRKYLLDSHADPISTKVDAFPLLFFNT